MVGNGKYRYTPSMKTSIDLPDDLYRRVKSKSALEGLAVREVATALFAAWVDGRIAADPANPPSSGTATADWQSRWQALGAAIAQSTGTDAALVDQLRADRR